MRKFNSTAALAVLALSLIFLGAENLLLSFALAAVVGIVYAALFRKKTVIAFDSGGVIMEGDYFTQEVKERPGMRDLVKKLKQNYRVVLLTNQNALAQKLFAKKFGLGKLFDAQIVSGEIGVKKPNREIFDYVADKFDVKPSDIVFVDDAAENVDSAKSFGLKAVQFTSLEGLLAEFRRLKITV